jgi:hypothetical protein
MKVIGVINKELVNQYFDLKLLLQNKQLSVSFCCIRPKQLKDPVGDATRA